eukprot:4863154-Prymnesium_polylepis.1
MCGVRSSDLLAAVCAQCGQVAAVRIYAPASSLLPRVERPASSTHDARAERGERLRRRNAVLRRRVAPARHACQHAADKDGRDSVAVRRHVAPSAAWRHIFEAERAGARAWAV